MRNVKRLIVLRGLPGTGKSTRAKQMQEQFLAEGKTAAHYEADMYLVGEDGVYRFDPDRSHTAHEWCKRMAAESLDTCDAVIVANTNLTEQEMLVWKMLAEEKHAKLEVYHLKAVYGSIHNVPEDVIEQMRAREIDWPGETLVEKETRC